jgi:GT2 family glycosyltransferase
MTTADSRLIPKTSGWALFNAKNAPRVTTVVLNWNRPSHTLSCLDALDHLTTQHRAIVVDNGSSDGSERQIREARPDICLLQTGENLGYAGGNNHGIQAGLDDDSDFVWILNNDALPRPDTLGELLAVMYAQPGVGIVSSVASQSNHATATLGQDPVSCPGCEDGFHFADGVMGASLLFRSNVFCDVGLFDERYFHYAEEKDLATRAFRAGWQLGLACRSVVEHERGASLPGGSPQASYYMIRNIFLYERRFHDRGTLSYLLHHRRRLRACLALRTSARERDLRRIIAVTLAVSDGARGRTGQRDLGDRYHRVQAG